MHETKHKRALPVYIAAAVFALYALLLPLYSLWHFLMAALVTAAVWLIADKLIPPLSEYDYDECDLSVTDEAAADKALTGTEVMTLDTEVKVMDRILDSDGLGEADAIQECVKTAPVENSQAKEENAQTEFAAAEEAMLRAAQNNQE